MIMIPVDVKAILIEMLNVLILHSLFAQYFPGAAFLFSVVNKAGWAPLKMNH